jgi:hypothetical protein
LALPVGTGGIWRQAGTAYAEEEDRVNGFEPHWEVLPTSQRVLWPRLAPGLKFGFVRYGGTAAALRLGHRSSIDFDFFTEKPIDASELEGEFSFWPQSTVIQQHPNALSVLAPSIGGNVKISFFGGIRIGRVGTPDLTGDGVMKIASMEDLLSTKLKVILQRIESKDYLDIVAILRSGVKLENGLGAATAMYNPNFQASEAMKALTYFEGGDLISFPVPDREYLTRAVSQVRSIPVRGIVSRSLF